MTTNYREILRLESLGLNKTDIASAAQCARNTVSTTLARAKACGLQWLLPEGMSDKELEERLFPSAPGKVVYKMPDYAHVHREMQRQGVTLTLLWLEYCDQCKAEGAVPYQSTQFNNALLVDLLDQRHDELRLHHNGVVLPIAVNHIHGVQPVPASGRNSDNRSEIAHRLHQRRILAFGVADQDIVIGVQHEEGNQLLGREALAGAGNAQQKRRLVQKVCFVAHDEVVGDRVLTEIDTTLIHDLLHLERHENREALGGNGSETLATLLSVITRMGRRVLAHLHSAGTFAPAQERI